MAKTMSFGAALREYREQKYLTNMEWVHIAIPNAKQVIWDALTYLLTQEGRTPKWLPAYDQVAEWLTDNQGRGLLCIGSCGLGKSLLCREVLPVIIYQYYNLIIPLYDARKINQKQMEQIMHEHLYSIDDIGCESENVEYGKHTIPFNDIVDEAEKRKSFMLLSTNLVPTHTVDKTGKVIPSIEDVYGIRTLDRLKKLTKVVVFKGPSFRE